jgi:putative membrane protein insertion efficiency factor
LANWRSRSVADVLPSGAVAKRRRLIFRVAAIVFAAAVLCDWMRPPSKQISVALYETVVIKGYRFFLQPWGRRYIRCRFDPTCSVYSEQAMQVHGFPKGLWLTTSRLVRCMPWVPYGTHDPVPPAKQ